LPKAQVRELAAEFDLPTAQRKDSQGICFLGKFDFADFVKAHLGVKPGDLIEFETGKCMGNHEGFWFYTIGQRQGIGLSGGPWYVVAKDAAANIVYISKSYSDLHVAKSGMIVTGMNWNQGMPSASGMYQVRFRHGAALHDAMVAVDGDQLRVMLCQESGQGIAAGQFCVLYQGEVCLGGGVIQKAL
jgi:tRNA-specific 2-thiouridylase